jgi:hypothetical protein
MVEYRNAPSDEFEEDITALDAANYCYAMAGEMARAARSGGLEALALALDHMKAVAALSLRQARNGAHPLPENPAPDEAA